MGDLGVGWGGVSLERGPKLLEDGNKEASEFGELPTLVRGMFVQRRQLDLAPGGIL